MALQDLLDQAAMEINNILLSLISLFICYFAYKQLGQFISRWGKRLELEAHAINGLRLLLRVVSILACSTFLFGIWNLPTEWFIGSSALIGAFLGFGSSQTINNVVAGFYVLITQPFKVKDYVKIGDMEGQVEEITINYTNLYTPSFNLLKVPNTQVMNSRILNLTHEGFIKYTFTMGFGHEVPNPVLMKNCILPAIDRFHEKYGNKQLRRPEAYFDSSDRFGRSFLIRIFIPKGEAKDLYTLKPELLEMITDCWHDAKKSA